MLKNLAILKGGTIPKVWVTCPIKNHSESKHSQRGKNIHLKFGEVVTLKRAYGQTLVWVLWRYKRLFNKLRQCFLRSKCKKFERLLRRTKTI